MTPLPTRDDLPGLDRGLCGFRNCEALAERLEEDPALVERCPPRATGYLRTGHGRGVGADRGASERATVLTGTPVVAAHPPARLTVEALPCNACSPGAGTTAAGAAADGWDAPGWRDTLGREFDFFLEHFPEDPGPREIILPHNPLLTRELNVQVGDVLIGRPLGMSSGCPITHCGVVMQADQRTGVMTWCVTGPLRPRQDGYKDLGYYVAEGYEGLIRQSRCEINIGRRYFFQPRMCMLQWRHSGLVNFLNRTEAGLSVRVEGLWIG